MVIDYVNLNNDNKVFINVIDYDFNIIKYIINIYFSYKHNPLY